MKVSSPVRRGVCGKVPESREAVGQLATFPPNLNTSMIRVGELFREAIKVNAAALIVAHNV
jgi:DNA repair protein RadC